MAHKFQQLYDYLERRIPELLACVSPLLTESDIAEAKKYLDLGEYGLAVETIYFAAEESQITLPDEATAIVSELASKMGLKFDTSADAQ